MTTVKRNLRLHGVDLKSVDANDLGRWIYGNPARCPAERLGYEAHQEILKNTQDALESPISRISSTFLVSRTSTRLPLIEECVDMYRRLLLPLPHRTKSGSLEELPICSHACERTVFPRL